jgi:hypothetical protein
MNRTFLKIITSMAFISFICASTSMAQNINEFKSSNPKLVNGAISVDKLGHFRTIRDESLETSPLFSLDSNNIPSQFYNPLSSYFLGFDAYRDLESIAGPDGNLLGFFALDKFAAVHPYTVTSPSFNYSSGIANYNTGRPEQNRVYLPFFGSFAEGSFSGLDLDILGLLSLRGGDNAIARDIELAIDWRSATNAFQGYYILDAFGGVHYVNNAEVLGMLRKDGFRDVETVRLADSGGVPIVKEPLAYEKFFEVFGFRARYMVDYVGTSPTDKELKERGIPPYWPGLPIARDLEVMVRFEKITPAGEDKGLVEDSMDRDTLAKSYGIDTASMFTPLAMSPNRNNFDTPEFTPEVAITNGYAILDGFGAVHTLVEDKDGNAIPAPWEDPLTGAMDPSVNAPYFYNFDLAVDFEIMANNGGFCLLTRTGDVFVVNAKGMDASDNFVTPGIEKELPSFGFDAARDLTLVSNDEGKVVGMYVVDRFGTIHSAGDVPTLPSSIMFFQDGKAQDLEISPYPRPVTAAK